MGRVIRMTNNKVLRNKGEDLFKKKLFYLFGLRILIQFHLLLAMIICNKYNHEKSLFVLGYCQLF
jgi:hypothetical protein